MLADAPMSNPSLVFPYILLLQAGTDIMWKDTQFRDNDERTQNTTERTDLVCPSVLGQWSAFHGGSLIHNP